MHILFITDGLPPETLGGSGRIVAEVSHGLHRLGHRVTILTSGRGPRSETNEGITIHRLVPRSARFAHYRSVLSRTRAQEVLDIVDAAKPDVIHGHTLAWQCGYRWIAGAAGRGIPCILTAHDAMLVAYGKVTGQERSLLVTDLRRARFTWNPLRNLFIRRALSQCSAILCVSDALRTYLEKRGVAHLRTLHNGIDLSFWAAETPQKEARAKLGLPPNTPLFLLGGRLGHDKGLVLLFKLWPKLKGNPHLLLAGKLSLPIPAHLESQVYVFRDQTPPQMRLLYAACDVAVVPSIYLDPFPTICLEAMACARPVIATSFGGAPESVSNGRTGWIVNPLEEEMLKKKLQWCIDHRAELPFYGSAGRKHVEAHFSLEHYLSALSAIYEECLKEKRRE